MKLIFHILALALVMALPALGFAAEEMTVAQQQSQPLYDGMQQGQPQGQPPMGMPGQQRGQNQGQPPQNGVPGVRQPQPPVVQSPGMQPGMQPGYGQQGYGQQGRHQNRQAKALMRCNQRQASCAQNCNRRTYGRTRNMCNNQCNAGFVNCTTRANMR